MRVSVPRLFFVTNRRDSGHTSIIMNRELSDKLYNKVFSGFISSPKISCSIAHGMVGTSIEKIISQYSEYNIEKTETQDEILLDVKLGSQRLICVFIKAQYNTTCTGAFFFENVSSTNIHSNTL